MQGVAFPAPVLPGQETGPGRIAEQLKAHPELGDFVKRGGIAVLRVFQMSTPQGDVVTTYVEADPVERVFELQQRDPSPVAVLLRTGIKETHGIDISQEEPPVGEQLFEHYEPSSPRQPGLGFSAPVLPGREGLLKTLGAETAGSRKDQWTAFNRDLGVSVHRTFLLSTPMGSFSSVYFEAPDPVAANQAFAADSSEFGKHFKATAEEALGIDFNDPLPPIRQVFEVTAKSKG